MSNQPTRVSSAKQPKPSDETAIAFPEGEEEWEYVYEDDEEDARGGCSGCGWGLAGAIGCLAIPLTAFAVLIFMGINTVGGIFDGVLDIFDPPPPVYNILDTPTILQGVQDLSQLTTTRHSYSRVVITERELPQLLRALYRDKLTLYVVGHVEAGVDLGSLTETDVTVVDGALTIQLPPPQIQDCVLYEQETRVVSRDTGLFTDTDPRIDAHARRFAISVFRDAALREGILDSANVQARSVIESFLSLLTLGESITEIRVLITPPDPEAPLPESCLSS